MRHYTLPSPRPLRSTSDNVQDFSSVLAVLVDHSFQPTVSAQDREAARAGLETSLDTLVTTLENNQVQYLVIVNVPSGQSSAKLPVTRSLSFNITTD